jgi:hypothetical protein
MMATMKRVPPSTKWVERSIENERDSEVEGLF